jgi:hypothetical protein
MNEETFKTFYQLRKNFFKQFSAAVITDILHGIRDSVTFIVTYLSDDNIPAEEMHLQLSYIFENVFYLNTCLLRDECTKLLDVILDHNFV